MEHFAIQYLKRQINQSEVRNQKVIKKVDKMCVKWKGYNNSFKSWIGQSDIL